MAVAPSAFVPASGLLSASPFPSSSSLAQGGKNVARLSALDQTESRSSAWSHFMIGCVGAGLMGAAGRRRPKTRGSEQLSRSGAVVANKMEVSTPFPKIDRSKTKELRKKLMTSDQYFRFSKTQMDQAMSTLKSTSGSDLMMRIRENGFRLTIGDITFVLAESYGFCWGVERTLAMAYEARNFFPDKMIWVTNEIIHNAVVNKELEGKGMRFVPKAADGTKDFSGIKQGDVCILPAFGASIDEMALLKEKGVQIVDATCPWVAKVWNSVEKSKEKGHTSIIHGKYAHEETVATKSFAEKYIVVKDLKQAEYVANYMLNGGKKDEFLKTFKGATSDGFDPDTDLNCVGVANQTTMLKGETELIGRLFERVMIKKYGPQNLSKHFISFNTICDATQERQDAMYNLLGERYIPPSSVVYAGLEGEQVGVELQSAARKGKSLSSKDKEAATRGGVVETSSAPPPRPDLCLVVGGFNSSNTFHLIEIPEEFGIPTYHIDCAARISGNVPGANVIQHKPLLTSVSDAMVEKGLEVTEDFLPAGPVVIGVTAGASTPDSSTAQCLQKILAIRGLTFS